MGALTVGGGVQDIVKMSVKNRDTARTPAMIGRYFTGKTLLYRRFAQRIHTPKPP
jgi:hypothetical protein